MGRAAVGPPPTRDSLPPGLTCSSPHVCGDEHEEREYDAVRAVGGAALASLTPAASLRASELSEVAEAGASASASLDHRRRRPGRCRVRKDAWPLGLGGGTVGTIKNFSEEAWCSGPSSPIEASVTGGTLAPSGFRAFRRRAWRSIPPALLAMQRPHLGVVKSWLPVGSSGWTSLAEFFKCFWSVCKFGELLELMEWGSRASAGWVNLSEHCTKLQDDGTA